MATIRGIQRVWPVWWLMVWLWGGSAAHGQVLEGIATLPANTFAPGPTSGRFIAPRNGVTPPFTDRQPVQGFSSLLRTRRGHLLGMCDNGFGSKANSPDFVLRVYRLVPDFATARGGAGTIRVGDSFTLHDPDRKIGFPLVADGTHLPDSATPVDPAIQARRLLTGADFDIESMREARDGTFWFGDELGPFLIHTDRRGRVLEAPISLPGVWSPDHPELGDRVPNLPRSRGFEGMAISPDGQTLYPMLEGALAGEPDPRRLLIHEFDVRRRRYTGRRWSYRLSAPCTTGQAIGDLTALSARRFLVVERDDRQGAAAAFKKVFVVDLGDIDGAGYLTKREVVDLMDVPDPDRLAGREGRLRWSFQTIESLVVMPRGRIALINDNNYPFGNARAPDTPDPSELILLRLERFEGRDAGRERTTKK